MLPFTTVIHKLFGGLREREGWQACPNVEKEELARTSTISDRQYSTLSCIISECLEAIEVSIPQSNVSKDGLPLIPRGKGVSSELRDVFTLEGSASRTRDLYVVIIVWM